MNEKFCIFYEFVEEVFSNHWIQSHYSLMAAVIVSADAFSIHLIFIALFSMVAFLYYTVNVLVHLHININKQNLENWFFILIFSLWLIRILPLSHILIDIIILQMLIRKMYKWWLNINSTGMENSFRDVSNWSSFFAQKFE